MGWRASDTVLVLAAFSLPFVSTAFSLATYQTMSIGDYNTVEISYTGWALIGLALSIYKTYLLSGDQLALQKLDRGWREWLTGLWTLSHAFGYVFIFLMWAMVGMIAGQLPNPPVAESPVDGVPPNWITGGAFLLVEGVLLGIMVFGLICRRRLTE